MMFRHFLYIFAAFSGNGMWVMGVQLICDMEITGELCGGQCELNWQTGPIVQGFQKEIPHK